MYMLNFVKYLSDDFAMKFFYKPSFLNRESCQKHVKSEDIISLRA